jgi:3-mercaptopyruvate sulfurtransferase SseA
MQTLSGTQTKTEMLAICALLLALQTPSLTADSPELRISYNEFRKLYDRGHVLVLDTRGEGSYRVGHIPGAEWLSLDGLEARIPALKKARRPIVTYCS